jgi:Zn-dependent peptidase ImmA (M78 family)
MIQHINQRTPNIIGAVRALMPNRALTHIEALHTAELQANKLLELSGIVAAPVPDTVITDLPRIEVQHLSPLGISGFAAWNRGQWLIAVNASESPLRQRFSLAHEFKHVLDHPFIDDAYTEPWGQSAEEAAERSCDYFAGCLLMPKAWIKRDFYDQGIQELPTLARRFQVSQAAMRVRLLQLGLIQSGPRCASYRRQRSGRRAAFSPMEVAA